VNSIGALRTSVAAIGIGVVTALLLQGCSSASASAAPNTEPSPEVSLIARSANVQTCAAKPALFSAYDRGGLFALAVKSSTALPTSIRASTRSGH
jgi:hypothetical protein